MLELGGEETDYARSRTTRAKHDPYDTAVRSHYSSTFTLLIVDIAVLLVRYSSTSTLQ